MKRTLIIPLVLLWTSFVYAEVTPWHASDVDIVEYADRYADHIIEESQWKLYRYKPILYTSFVELDDLQHTSSFGRLMGELFSTRMAQHGYKVVEMKMRKDNILVKERIGEMVLSRDVNTINRKNNAQAVLVGTYKMTEKEIYVNVRMISTIDRSIIAARSFVVPRGNAELYPHTK